MKNFTVSSTIIHAFALLHAGTSVMLLSRGSSDEAILTLLTMTMIVLLCNQRKVSIQFTILSVIAGNILGYIIGLGGAEIMNAWNLPGSLANTISTFVTTELLGWMLYIITGILNRLSYSGDMHSKTSPLWLLVILIVIFGIRLILIDAFDGDLYSVIDITNMSMQFLSNSLAMLVMVCGDILAINLTMRSRRIRKNIMRGIIVMASAFILALAGATMVALNFPFGSDDPASSYEFIRYFVVGIALQMILVVLVFLVDGSIRARTLAMNERSKAHLAQYRYMKLKQQVNPHFLFNNLNMLDYLVSERENEKASTYIQKLAGIYRYMIRNEEETTVPLSDEIHFVEQYVELMKVRFPEGLDISMDIPEDDMQRRVIPCCVQLLIENATKHNIVSADEPLVINVMSTGTHIIVTNTLNLKHSNSIQASTGLGLKYIREQYEDIAGRDVMIDDHASHNGRNAYKVTIPLL